MVSIGVVAVLLSIAFPVLSPGLVAGRYSDTFAVHDSRWIGAKNGRKVVLYSMLSCELCREVHSRLLEYVLTLDPQDVALAVRFVYEDKDSWDYHGAALALSCGASTSKSLFGKFAEGEAEVSQWADDRDLVDEYQAVEQDMSSATALRLGSVPTIVVEGYGRLIIGSTPLYMIRQVDGALRRER